MEKGGIRICLKFLLGQIQTKCSMISLFITGLMFYVRLPPANSLPFKVMHRENEEMRTWRG